MKPGRVYLIEAQTGQVKIGFSSNPFLRLSILRRCSPVSLRLIAIWPGRIVDELALQQRFDDVRSHGEWFRNDGAFAKFVLHRIGIGLTSIEAWDAYREESRHDKAHRVRALRSEKMKIAWERARTRPSAMGLVKRLETSIALPEAA